MYWKGNFENRRAYKTCVIFSTRLHCMARYWADREELTILKLFHSFTTQAKSHASIRNIFKLSQ